MNFFITDDENSISFLHHSDPHGVDRYPGARGATGTRERRLVGARYVVSYGFNRFNLTSCKLSNE